MPGLCTFPGISPAKEDAMRGPGRASALICELAGTSEKPANGTWLSSAYLAQKTGLTAANYWGCPAQ